jgi:signal transduction histidine kinase
MSSSTHSHRVQLYRDRVTLAEQVAELFAQALASDGGAIMIARSDLIEAVSELLRKRGHDIAAPRVAFVPVETARSAILPDGFPDRERFRAMVGGLLAQVRAASSGGPIHVFGELVDVLWQRGDRGAVLALEQLWHELGREQPFVLVCGYDFRRFQPEDTCELDAICALHEHVSMFDEDPDRAIVALEQRARQLESEIARRERVEAHMLRLLAVTSELAAARTRDEIVGLAVEEGRTAVDATSAVIWLLGDGELVLAAQSDRLPGDLEPYRTIDPTSDILAAHVLRTRQPVFLESRADYKSQFPKSYERVLPLLQAGELAAANLPIAADNGAFGVMCMFFDRARTFGGADRAFMALLARQCGFALERIHLHALERAQRETAEQAALSEKGLRVVAEEAMRAHEDILSVVSHDLRNPLSAVMMSAGTLLLGDAPDEELVRSTARHIYRQAERMQRQIADLVDYAGMRAGRLAIARSKHAPEAIIAAAREMFEPVAKERGLTLETRMPTGLAVVDCDSERAVQVIANLVSNAVKVTPRGGRIEIGAEPRDRDVLFFVADTGPGIDPAELPNLFERFWRSKSPRYKGTGLGLSIARRIVDAHGGRIWAESELGRGSKFYFSLSSAQV